MMLDVTVEIEIRAEPTAVAAVMFDPHREPDWMTGVGAVEVLDPGIKPGARVRRSGFRAGTEASWTTEVVSFHFPHLLELRVTDGPLPGMLIYQVGRSAHGSMARIRQVGELAAPAAAPPTQVEDALRAALVADLRHLKSVVEAGPGR